MNIDKLYRLTTPQRDILLTEQYYKSTSVNNVVGRIAFKERIDINLLRKTLEIIVKQNDALRIKITKVNGEYYQYFGEYNDDYVEKISIDETIDKDKKIRELSRKHITVLNNNLMKFYLLKYENGTADVLSVSHHIVADAWTVSMYAKEIIRIYQDLKHNKEIENITYSYKEYIDTEDNYLQSERFEDDKKYWQEQYKNERTTQFFEITNNPRGKRKNFILPKELVNDISKFCKENGISAQCLFMSAFSIYLSKISSSKNIAIGMPVLNRKNVKLKNTMGMFIETLPFCVDVNSNLSCADFLKNINEKQFSFMKHYRYPYEILQKDVKEKLDTNQKMYSVAFSYQNAKIDNSFMMDCETNWEFNGYCADDLQIHISDMQNTGTFIINYDYKANSIAKEEVINIHNRLLYIIKQITTNTKQKIKNIEIITEDERNTIVNTFNNTDIVYNKDKNIIEIISDIAQKYPNSIAIEDQESKISYKDLIEKVNIMTNILSKEGIKKGNVIGVLLEEKSIELIISILAALKVGASFIMLYNNLPEERIRYILKDSKAKALLTKGNLLNKYTDINNIDINRIYKYKNFKEINANVNMNDVAYLIYTSGTTGKPKGTEQTVGNLINFVNNFYNILNKDITNKDNFLSLTNVSFDVCIAEIFTPLFYGAKLSLYKDITYSTIEEIVKYIAKNKITFAYFPPSMLEDISDIMDQYKEKIVLNKILVGVEPIKTTTLEKLINVKPDIHIINGYGPSETTICSTMYDFTNQSNEYEIVPIGHPIDNTKIYIMNADKNILPINTNGEIYISGDGVGKGYKNNKELTNEKYQVINGMRMFKTGDIGRWDKNGNIIFVGRNDNQIKFRGYRIDLGEIENSLKSNNEIKNAKVILDKENYREEKLIAFVILNDKDMLEESLREFLSKTLPYYMMPSKFIKLDTFPLNNNGKIDNSKLMNIALEQVKENIVLPSTKTENAIYNIVKEKVGEKVISINDNFLDLGIDSLEAISLIIEFEKINLKFTLQDFYNYPSIRLLAEKLDKKITKVEESKTYIKEIDNKKVKKLTIDGDILLLGATGFLGSHILEKLLNFTSQNIYCLVRSNTKEKACSRLREILIDYFDEDFYEKYEKRIIALNGDFTVDKFGMNPSDFKKIKQNVTMIINSAACVKHFGSSEYFYNINYNSVKKALEFCKKENKHFVQISTMSVFEGAINEEAISESTLYCGQQLENIYIKTKFEAEQLVAESINEGNTATIFRLGNIMWRKRDGKFQLNEQSNAFITKLKTITQYKVVLDNIMEYKTDISPVDLCATAIVKILLDNKLNIYHIENNNKISISDLVNILNDIGYSIKVVDKETYKKKIVTDLEDKNELIALLENEVQAKNINSNISYIYLENEGFKWNDITKEYIKKYIN